MDITSYLKKSSLFSGLDANTLEKITEYFQSATFPKGSVICREGEAGDKMFIITKGEASAIKDLGFVHRELSRMHTGELFGEMALISKEKRTATVKAISDVECLEMGEDDFSQILNENPFFSQHVLRLLTNRLRHSDETATQELLNAHQALVFSLAQLAESRDPETGAHLYRVREYCALLSDRLQQHPRFSSIISYNFIESIYFVSPLHDIGKVAIPDNILLKPGKLTGEEFDTMKLHARRGAETIGTVLEKCREPAFEMAYNIVLHHHEKYNGKGYPDGLCGEDIPVEARIASLVDVYDALLTKRPYKSALSIEETCKIIESGAGDHFDPYMTEVMMGNIKEFERIHKEYSEL